MIVSSLRRTSCSFPKTISSVLKVQKGTIVTEVLIFRFILAGVKFIHPALQLRGLKAGVFCLQASMFPFSCSLAAGASVSLLTDYLSEQTIDHFLEHLPPPAKDIVSETVEYARESEVPVYSKSVITYAVLQDLGQNLLPDILVDNPGIKLLEKLVADNIDELDDLTKPVYPHGLFAEKAEEKIIKKAVEVLPSWFIETSTMQTIIHAVSRHPEQTLQMLSQYVMDVVEAAAALVSYSFSSVVGKVFLRNTSLSATTAALTENESLQNALASLMRKRI